MITLGNQLNLKQASHHRIFCRAMHDQRGYDMKRRVIAGDRVILTEIGTLVIQLLTLHDYFIAIAYFPSVTCSKRSDGLRIPPIFRIVTDGIAEDLALHDIVTTSASWGAIAVLHKGRYKRESKNKKQETRNKTV